MIKVSIFYQNLPGARFDFEYYRTRHFPLVLELLRPHGAERFEIDRGVASGDGSAPEFLAIGHLLLKDLPGFQAGMQQHGARIVADIANYTTIQPTLQISDIIL